MEGGAIQADGTMVEININPASNSVEFIENINKVLDELQKYLPPSKYKFVYEPVIIYDRPYFNSLPDSVKVLGCSPDYNAWKDGAINPPPDPIASFPTLRTCSGHIHIGWTKDADIFDVSHLWDARTLVKLLDSNLYKTFLKVRDPDSLREMMYGKPGAFRPKSYGVEWRVPSNFWMKSSSLSEAMFNIVMAVTKGAMTGEWADRIKPGFYEASELPQRLRYLACYAVPEKKKKSTHIVRGARVAPTSGPVTYDLDLDVPVSIGGKYTGPSGFSFEIV